MRPWDPERIGPYAIVSRLGAGAMGQVYLARSIAGRLVAIKTIKPELAEEEGFRTRFAQEVAAARRVSGFFTAAVVEADPDADVPWLATAYVPAPSLRRMVQVCGPLPAVTVRWAAMESTTGVGLRHAQLNSTTIIDDAQSDVLTSGGSQDWFIADTTDPLKERDHLNGKNKKDLVSDL